LFQDEKACITWVKETKGEREVAERFNDAEFLDNVRKCKIFFRGFVVDFLGSDSSSFSITEIHGSARDLFRSHF
jgi:hypothetical protein